MHNAEPRKLQVYRDQNGRELFTEWFHAIRDTRTRTRIRKRLERLEAGNFGDCKPVGDGVLEMLLHFGPGYRIYFAQIDNTLVLLICGGISHRRNKTLRGQRIAGCNTRRHNDERTKNMA